MRLLPHLRESVRAQAERVAGQLHAWEEAHRLSGDEADRVRKAITPFAHSPTRPHFLIGGVDGSGDYPTAVYGDSFVYVTLAQGALFEVDVVSGLKEVGPLHPPAVDVAWIPEDEAARRTAFDEVFTRLAGMPIREVISRSDYRRLKADQAERTCTVETLLEEIVRPHASDTANIAVHLRSTGELGEALRLLTGEPRPDYVLVDTTFSLPLVGIPIGSLFFEHLKRLCCVEARRRGTGIFALSKSHGLASVESLEELAREKCGVPQGQVAEHWFFRIPVPDLDGWSFSLAGGKRLPPPGAVSYLFRLHRTTPVLRLDMDRALWLERVRGKTEADTRVTEERIFKDLDYAAHDQRCFGYPYPLKAGHDRASLTQSEREGLRKMIIDAAVEGGLRRSYFRDPSQATGHA